MADKDERARLERIVAIACDHGGFALKEALKVALPDVKWLDLGTDSAASVDYPDFGKLADAIEAGKAGQSDLRIGHRHVDRCQRPGMTSGSKMPDFIDCISSWPHEKPCS